MREIRKYFEMSKRRNTTYQNSQNSAKAVLNAKFITVNIYVKKGRSHINKVTFHLKKLKKEEQTKPKQKKGNNKD